MARTKRSTDKAKAATEKIDNLLKDTIGLTKEEPKDAVEESVQEKGNDWLADQVTALTTENEQLKEDLKKAFIDIEKLRNAPDAPADVEQIKAGVAKIFRDLEDNYLGRNQTRTRYVDAKIKILLDKFVGTFPFLTKK